MVVGGFGVEEIDIEEDEDGQPVITETYEDAFTDIFPDPFFRGYDWNGKHGAKYVIKAPWMHIHDAIAFSPENEEKLKQCMRGEGFIEGMISSHYIVFHEVGRVQCDGRCL